MQGASCYGTNTNEVYADFGYEFVGSTCLTTANTHAALWTFLSRAFMYVNGMTYNLSFYLTDGPTVPTRTTCPD